MLVSLSINHGIDLSLVDLATPATDIKFLPRILNREKETSELILEAEPRGTSLAT